MYFGDPLVNAVTCVLAVMDLAATFPWFSLSARDIRMRRVEEFNDLMPAVQQGARRIALWDRDVSGARDSESQPTDTKYAAR